LPRPPEYRWTSGVETTTGPLGNGLATSVGMAIAGRWMAAHFSQPGFQDLIDFNVYAMCGAKSGTTSLAERPTIRSTEVPNTVRNAG
jgi:transketolase